MRKVLFAVLLVPLALAACSTTTDRAATPATTPTASQGSTLSASVAKAYNSVGALEADSAAVVRVTAGPARVEIVNEIPFTITSVTVKQVVWGTAPKTATVPVWQTGTTKDVADLSELLAKGQEYLLFLRTIPEYPGQYNITGDQGIWVLDQVTSQYRYAGVDGPTLPMQLSPASVKSGAFLLG